MSNLTLTALTKKFGDHLVVNNVNLNVMDQDFLVLLGPSGCGKTTALRMVAGLEKVTSGQILLDGEVINNVPPQLRDMAMVFQNYALYAHLNVFDNLAFGLRMRKVNNEQIRKRVVDVAQMLQIERLLERKPRQLSGGERQRVALGRAIVRQPRLFLMDEPLSNLDALLRIQTRTEILQLCRKIGATVIYVTHDQTEAMTMGQRVVVLRDGKIQQVDAPMRIYNRPANRFVAEFVGSPPINILRDMCLSFKEDQIWAKKQGITIDLGNINNFPGLKGVSTKGLESVDIGIRPENLYLDTDRKADSGIPGTVEVLEQLGRETLVYIDIGSQLVRVLVEPSFTAQRGDSVFINLERNKVNLFDKDSGVNLDSSIS